MPNPGLYDRIVQRILDRPVGWRMPGPGGMSIDLAFPDVIERCHRAKLLIRNKKFIDERRRLLKEMAMKKRSRINTIKSEEFSASERRKRHDPSHEKLAQQKHGALRLRNTMRWQDFCYRWGLNDLWKGDLDTLDHSAIGEAEVFSRRPSGESASLPLGAASINKNILTYFRQRRGKRWAESVEQERVFIYLKISPTTHREDLVNYWPWIDTLKKEIFGFSGRPNKTFERDLCWWDLHSPEYEELATRGSRRDGIRCSPIRKSQVVARWLRRSNGSRIISIG